MKEFLQQKGSAFSSWLGVWCKENIDFALILAVCTETPRWTVTFMAIHEPLWIGISLGVLLAFATSKVWRHYFTTRSKITLTFNVLAIILAVLVIAPVLFAMIEHKPDQVDIAQVLQDAWLRWAWSFGLALTTFVPLVQLAAVHGVQVKHAQLSIVHSAKTVQPDAQPKPAQWKQVDNDDARRARELKDEGLTNIQIAQEMNVHRNTVGTLLKSANEHKEPAQ